MPEAGGGRANQPGQRTRKELVPVESDDEQTEVQCQVLRTSVAVLDLDSGAVEVVELGGAAVAAPDPRARAA